MHERSAPTSPLLLLLAVLTLGLSACSASVVGTPPDGTPAGAPGEPAGAAEPAGAGAADSTRADAVAADSAVVPADTTDADPGPPDEGDTADEVGQEGARVSLPDFRGLPDAAAVAAALATARERIAGMGLREKVGQMMMPVVLGDYSPEGTPGHDRIVNMIERYGIGGVIVSVGSPTDVAVKLNDFQRHSRVPLLVAADLETGAGFRMKGAVHLPTNILLGGATDFPSLMAVGATGSPELAYDMGRVTALEARAVGIHVPFAPVLDVNSNPANPIINVRSFGEDPGAVGRMGAAFVRGVEEHGAMATGKHFPGHGDTETDSHIELPLIRADRLRLDTLELRPFQDAIDAGMSAVMTAHIAVPSLTGSSDTPATLSRPVLTDLLRDEMGFEGLLFTDAMDMGAIVRRYGQARSAALAVQAGADVILMPPSVGDAVEGIVSAVERGDIDESRIDASVLRILATKARMGLFERSTVELDSIPGVVGIPAHLDKSAEIARRSITLLRNEGGVLPLLGTRDARVLSVTYRRSGDLLASRWFDARLRSTYPRLTTETIGRDTGAEVFRGLLAEARRSDLVVVSLYITAVSYSGSVMIPDRAAGFLRQLATSGVPHVVVSFGNPYLLREFPDVRAYMLAWSSSEASQRAAADALLGRFDITGRTPTRIPPHFEIGAGIRLPARGSGGGSP